MTEEFPVLTPVDIEKQLRKLSRDIATAQQENARVEHEYSTGKAKLEIGMAKTRLKYANASKSNGKNYTVDERADLAITENEEEYMAVAVSEAQVKASRGRINQLNTQTDIARSVSTSVRSSMATESGRG